MQKSLSTRKIKPHLQFTPGAKVTVVFSCPGEKERVAKRPAAGITGDNLNALLEYLKTKTRKAYFTRDKITITNAWSGIEFRAHRGRSEATDAEIIDAKNLARLTREIGGPDIIIASGRKAQLAVSLLELDKKVVVLNVPHLGGRGLSSIKLKGETPRARNLLRIHKIGHWLLPKLTKPGHHHW